MSDTERTAYIAGLRTLADRLERHPDAPLPYTGIAGRILVMPYSEVELAAAARCYGGTKGLDYEGELCLDDGIDGLKVRVLTSGAGVCELVDTGEVEEYEDVEVVREAETVTVTKTRPVMRRECPPSLLALGAEASV